MATEAYRRWVAAGRPFTLARPIDELQTWARAAGVAVLGTIGNEGHLTKDQPEDHTPFSTTEWPVALPGYIITAIDLQNVRLLGPKIEAQARAGRLPWLKYMNHSGRHISFKGPQPVTSTSPDEHVHLSIRTDWATRSVGRFDPWNAAGGEDMTKEEHEALFLVLKMLTRLDGREPIGMAYQRMARGYDDTMPPDAPVGHPSLTSLGTQLATLTKQVGDLQTRPAVQLDRALLVDALTEVIGKVDGR